MDRMLPFIEAHLARGVPLNSISRHMLGLFHGPRRPRHRCLIL